MCFLMVPLYKQSKLYATIIELEFEVEGKKIQHIAQQNVIDNLNAEIEELEHKKERILADISSEKRDLKKDVNEYKADVYYYAWVEYYASNFRDTLDSFLTKEDTFNYRYFSEILPSVWWERSSNFVIAVDRGNVVIKDVTKPIKRADGTFIKYEAVDFGLEYRMAGMDGEKRKKIYHKFLTYNATNELNKILLKVYDKLYREYLREIMNKDRYVILLFQEKEFKKFVLDINEIDYTVYKEIYDSNYQNQVKKYFDLIDLIEYKHRAFMKKNYL